MTSNFKETEIGLIPKEWNIKALPDILSNTVDNRGKSAPLTDTGIPLIATNCIKETGLYPTYEKIRFVSKDVYDNWFRDHPKTNDIIIVNKGTPGLVCLVPNPVNFCIAQDMIAIRANEKKIYFKFLFAYLRSPFFKHQVDINNVGTTIPHLKKTWFSKLFIPIPSYQEQRVIGDSYYNLSKKIDLNQKINQTLESIGQAIFKHWFVDFEFPDENGNPYKSSGGEMVDSELGEIPKGWKIRSLDQIAKYLNGLALQKYPPEKDEYLSVIKIRELKQGITQQTDRASINIPNEYIIEDGDIIFSWSGSLEVVIWGEGTGALNQHLFKISSQEYPKWFYYYQTLRFLPSFRQTAADKATTMGHIKRSHLSESKVPIPSQDVIKKAGQLLNPIMETIINNKINSRYLINIRNSLLPKLMSGKIRVNIPEEVL
jgi:type I restriction enzyme S subunit